MHVNRIYKKRGGIPRVLIPAGIILAALAFPAVHGKAQTPPDTADAVAAQVATVTLTDLEAVAEYALANSLDYRKALWSVEKAADAVPSALLLNSASLSFSPKLTAGGQSDTETLGWTAGLTVPILSQIGLSAQIDDSLNTSVSLTLNPLSHSDSIEQARISFEKAVTEAEQTAFRTKRAALNAALALAQAQKSYGTAVKDAELKQVAFEDQKTRYELDSRSVSLDDVKTALLALNDARTREATATQTLLKSQSDLYAALGSEVVLADVSAETLAVAVEELKASLSDLPEVPATTYEQKLFDFQAKSTQAKLDNTWSFDPNLSLNGGATIASDGTTGFTASLTLALGPDSFKIDERSEIERDLQFTISESEQTAKTIAYQFKQARISAEAAGRSRSGKELSLDQSREYRDEVAFLAERGLVSALELAEAELDLSKAENDLFASLAGEFLAWFDLTNY